MNDMKLRNQKIDLFGRSMILNISGIALNLVGVYLVVWGFHASAGDNDTLYKILGFSLVITTISSLIILKGIFLYSYIARALVGGLFIVSGLIKANDPWGFAFKLEEYFAPDGLSFDYPFFEWFEPYSLQLSVIICIAEIVLGVAVIVGGKIKLTSWLLVVMMLFFSWLTWYTTSCNDSQMAAVKSGVEFNRQCVTDCGCFGDALRGSVGRSLTPIESFWKDLTLFYFVLIIFFNQWKIKLNSVRENWAMVPASLLVVAFFCWVFGWIFPFFYALFVLLGAFVVGNLNIGKIGKPWKMAIFVAFISLIFSVYTTMYLPLKDYRPYRIGNNIREEMNKGVAGVSEFVFRYEDKSTGKQIEVSDKDWNESYSNTDKYTFVDRVEKVISEGVDSPIKDFRAAVDYENLTEEDKQVPVIDSIGVTVSSVSLHNEDFITAKSAYGIDTISVLEYDPEYYPDSLYTIGPKFTILADPGQRFEIDLTNYLITTDNVFLMTIRDIESVNLSHIADFKSLYEKATEKGVPFFVLSPATQEQISKFKRENDFNPTFLSFDGVEVKIIVRSNPGLVLVRKGTVIDKWPCRSVPEFENVYEEFIQK